MIFKRIRIENFRQLKSIDISFSTDPDKNVTIIIGDNTAGKSTLAKAITWCLYNKAQFDDRLLLNRDVSHSLRPGEYATVRVILNFEHNGDRFELTREQEYLRDQKNVVPLPVEQTLSQVINGNTEYADSKDIDSIIHSILPNELSDYFIFGGETIQRLSEDILSKEKNTSEDFADAVRGLLGLNCVSEAINHLDPRKYKNSVYGRFDNAIDTKANEELAKLTELISDLNNKINDKNNEIINVETEISSCSTLISSYENELKRLEESSNIQKYIEHLEHENDENEIKIYDIHKELTKQLGNKINGVAFFALSKINLAMESLKKADIKDVDFPKLHADTIMHILKKGKCVCGRQIGPDEEKELQRILASIPPNSLSTVIGEFKKECRMYLNGEISSFKNDIDKCYENILRSEADIESNKKKINDGERKLKDENATEQVKLAKDNLDANVTRKKELTEQLPQLKAELIVLKGKLKDQSQRKDKLSLSSDNNKSNLIMRQYSKIGYDVLLEYYKQQESKIRSLLQDAINDNFKKIFDVDYRLIVRDDYKVSVYGEADSDIDLDPSSSESITVLLSFISGVLQLAKKRKGEDGIDYISDAYPLVMDAPLSLFDKTHIELMCRVIPFMARQIIIFIKNTDGDLAVKHFENHLGKKMMFNKVSKYITEISES